MKYNAFYKTPRRRTISKYTRASVLTALIVIISPLTLIASLFAYGPRGFGMAIRVMKHDIKLALKQAHH